MEGNTPQASRSRRRTGREEDAALLRASGDERLGLVPRGIAWLAWAYRRSPPRVLTELADLTGLPDLLLAPLLRHVAFRAIGRGSAAEHRAATAGRNELVSSGWPGVVVFILLWGAVLAAAVAVLVRLGWIA